MCRGPNDLPIAPRISSPAGDGMTVRVCVTRLLGSFIQKCTLNRRKRRVRPATLRDIRLLGLPDRIRLYFRIRLALIRSLARSMLRRSWSTFRPTVVYRSLT